MKRGYIKKAAALGTAAVLTAGMLTGCGDKAETNKNGEEIVELTWYQVGDAQADDNMVFDEVNKYLADKIGVKLNVVKVGWGDYNQKMQVVINTGDQWDLCFTCSWANDYLQNAQKRGSMLSYISLPSSFRRSSSSRKAPFCAFWR